jgi:putative effector of murein hydrolase LrgA (UPF0299 family)
MKISYLASLQWVIVLSIKISYLTTFKHVALISEVVHENKDNHM